MPLLQPKSLDIFHDVPTSLYRDPGSTNLANNRYNLVDGSSISQTLSFPSRILLTAAFSPPKLTQTQQPRP
jgi:hypothetical protein